MIDRRARPSRRRRIRSTSRSDGIWIRIRRPGFAEKPGSGEARCDVEPESEKIFSLPKNATQSPRAAFFVVRDESQSRAKRSLHV
jgi:hypothetical protein